MTNQKKVVAKKSTIKNQPKMISNSPSETDEFKKLIFIIAIVAVISIAFYLIAVVVSNKKNQLKYKEINEKAQIEYDEILGSDIFTRGGEYYVLVLKKDNDFEALFKNYITAYKKKENHLMVYQVNLGNVFNRRYLGEENHLEPENFMVNDNVLLKIKDGTVTESYVGNGAITEQLYQLGKTE